MLTDLGGQEEQKPSCLQEGKPSPDAESGKRAGMEVLRLLKVRVGRVGLKRSWDIKLNKKQILEMSPPLKPLAKEGNPLCADIERCTSSVHFLLCWQLSVHCLMAE